LSEILQKKDSSFVQKRRKRFSFFGAFFLAVHLIKLAVGSQSIADVQRWQAQHPPARHRTRHFPRRADEVLDGGSLFWVINRVISARQRILDIVEGQRDDGTKCTVLMLDPVLVPVQGGLKKPFQGWRYLDPKDAPPDLAAGAQSSAEMPAAMRRELAALGLL
jgi:hypothetical protein